MTEPRPTPFAPDGTELPTVLAGPLLRRLTARQVVLWLATRRAGALTLTLHHADGRTTTHRPAVRHLQAGEHLHHLLVTLDLGEDLPTGVWTGYGLALEGEDLTGPDSGLCYPGRDHPGFVFAPRVRAVLHGSCRKPHHAGGGDGLVRADALLAGILQGHEATPWPSALVLSGDQVYCDDVAGPMLRAIHALMARLGLPSEPLTGAEAGGVTDTASLQAHPANLYRRETLLPRQPGSRALVEVLFGGVRKPVFTSDNAHNHLITLGEVLAMYLLVWSPLPWQAIDLAPPPDLETAHRSRYARERNAIEAFVAGLPAVRRVLAHLPSAMMFDDHDITDDWNLSREWEETAYGHPFSRRVIGNALIGYLLHQGWGNRPEAFEGETLDAVAQALRVPGSADHEACIDQLLRFDQWHHAWPTEPPLMLLDSRTHRWRSERAARQPSGLMDWEGLTDLQQALRGHPAVLLVSSAPIFGVKLIEVLQRAFTWIGRPLMVDAENWMAHPGAASAILNIFRHPRTPQTFVVLSGDVHYSFVYDVVLRPRGRLRSGGPHIWQVCSSGLRNTFPDRLLAVLDHLNRWLYAPRSPLNAFTRRRHMRVTPRKPVGTPHGRRLLNGSGVGLLVLDAEGRPQRIAQLMADGRTVDFVPREGEARED